MHSLNVVSMQETVPRCIKHFRKCQCQYAGKFSRNHHLNPVRSLRSVKQKCFPQTADKDTSRRRALPTGLGLPEGVLCPLGWVFPFQVTCEGVEYILVRQLCNFRVVWLIFTFLSQGLQRNQLSAEKFTSASKKTKHAAAFLSD